MTSAESTTIFTRSWSLYDLITEHNYMFHQEIYAGVGRLLSLRDDAGRYRLLDLGCGSARYLAPCLRQFPPAVYAGVDLSEAALIEARGYLADLPGSKVGLTQGDLLEAVEATSKTWDVIFTGFAVHHLTSVDKARFFQAVGSCLAGKGWLILVDVVREENQSREDYLEGYLKCMRDNWIKVPPDQLEEACTHVHDHDYPEYFSTLQEMAAAAGLQASRIVNQYGQHHTLLFARSFLPEI
ncbi:class I SAM-dependent methyltransferase [Nitrosomonas sp.]|uniref:class I SAM-dependent methyltransferase n=1 Tax=Nitrosomonas sp. TaxID=42353 RepID=UPI001DBAA356|nr:class I SAM-dependent methyltransferase [Nitrosomonas sp.]MBX9636899.1 methyltransferase domain-containing protein [Nitrosomonas sp.]MBY0484952.1 methyltransferase domain-containing protein [Nitrosomonas sp.]